MPDSSREGYRYLQVDRIITNRPAAFLGKVAALGQRILGEVPHAAIADYGLPLDDDQLQEPRTQVVPIRQPLTDIYGVDAVRLLLLRRTVPASMERRYNFNHHAARFTAPSKLRSIKGRGQSRLPLTVREKLDAVATDYGQNPRSMTVEFDSVQEFNDLGFTELALMPRVGVGSIILREQAKICSETLAELSNNAAYPTSPTTPAVPFMRVPEDIKPAQYERFVASLYDHLLPVQLNLGELDAHSRTIASSGC